MGRLLFKLFRYESQGPVCHHELLTRSEIPNFRNADQGMEDAAFAFAESAAEHLRAWWARWRLPLDCRAPHKSEEVAVADDLAVFGDALFERGLRHLNVWTASLENRGSGIATGAVTTEEEFWKEVSDSDVAGIALRNTHRRRVYFLTDADGSGDLNDS